MLFYCVLLLPIDVALNCLGVFQRQHKAKTDIFGDLHKLPEDEFKNFYNTTGIDIDNRIELMSEIATTLENGVSKYINFVKNIPGFISLCLEDQAALIKGNICVDEINNGNMVCFKETTT